MPETFKKERKSREWMVRGYVSVLNISNKGCPLSVKEGERGRDVMEKY